MVVDRDIKIPVFAWLLLVLNMEESEELYFHPIVLR